MPAKKKTSSSRHGRQKKRQKRVSPAALLAILPLALLIFLLARRLDRLPAVPGAFPPPVSSPVQTPEATPEPTPAETPAPEPSPDPTAEPSPDPTPEPGPEPAPDPTPTPEPEVVDSLLAAGLERPRMRTPEEQRLRLEALAAFDSRFLEAMDKWDSLPEMVRQDLCSNPELLDYVLGYPGEPSQGYFTEDELSGETPLLLQYDPRWCYSPYGSGDVAVTGCGPTVLSMAALHFSGREDATPDRMAAWALENDYYVYGAGTKWSLFTEGAAAWGLEGEVLPLWEGSIREALDGGKWVVLVMDPGQFTLYGHFIILRAWDGEGYRVLDPFSRARSGALWTYEQLSGEICNLWALGAAPEDGGEA